MGFRLLTPLHHRVPVRERVVAFLNLSEAYSVNVKEPLSNEGGQFLLTALWSCNDYFPAFHTECGRLISECYGATFTRMWLRSMICVPSSACRMMSNCPGPLNVGGA